MISKLELEFDEFLENTCFITDEGKILPVKLTDDKSSDPENDRVNIEEK